MFLVEPPTTGYDLRFQIWKFPVRVSVFFWVAAALFGWELAAVFNDLLAAATRFDPGLQSLESSNPGQGVLLVIWVAAMFASILIHELGHAVAMRYYGIESRVVLYHFGGLAIPDSAGSFMRFGGHSNPYQQIVISAAGPVAQFLLALVLVAGLKLSGSALLIGVPFLDYVIAVDQGEQLRSAPLQAAVYFLLVPSVFWPLLNLVPVYPLDGGQISRELFTLYSPRDGIRNSLILSVTAGVAVAIYAFLRQDTFLAILFAMLAFSSYQVLQAYSGRGGGFGSGGW